jgi:hypothetical protein
MRERPSTPTTGVIISGPYCQYSDLRHTRAGGIDGASAIATGQVSIVCDGASGWQLGNGEP